MSQNVEKLINKNVQPKLKDVTICEKEDKLGGDIGKVDMIKIKRGDNDPSSALMDIQLILNTFKNYPILFDKGDMCIHLRYDKDLFGKITINVNTKMLPLTRLTEVCNIYKTFVFFGTNAGKIHVLPKNVMTYSVFDKLRMCEANINRTVIVKLRDIIQKYDKDRKSHLDNIPDHLHTFRSSVNGTERETIVQNFTKRISDSQGKWKQDTSLKRHFKELKSSLKCVILPRHERIIVHYPVEDEQFKYPIQASSGELETQPEEQVTSAGHSTLFADRSYAFGSSTHVFPNISTSTASHRPANPANPARYGDYINYDERLASYSNWPLDSPSSIQLSKAGFFYTNQGDLVRCFKCGIGLKDFSADDDPLLEHVRHSRRCPFLPELLGEERLAVLKRQLQEVDPEFNRQLQLNGEVDPVLRSSYRHPEYQSIQARISSFTNWPLHLIQTPQRLAEAGLYYTGVEDHVRCFACDGGLRRWDPDDDPWTEHCRWFPACRYALEQKGEQFIALVQASVDSERFEASGGEGPEDVTGAMERLRLRDSETETVIKQHLPICLDMGFEDTELKEAIHELRDRGNTKPSIEDVVDAIEVIRERKQSSTESNAGETPFEENKRLKSHVFCMNCGENKINALFLPCTHHRLCMSCAEPLQACPVCRRHIKEKIRTYMV